MKAKIDYVGFVLAGPTCEAQHVFVPASGGRRL